MMASEIIQTDYVGGRHVAFCTICNKKCKGKTEHGLKTSIGMHYRKRHNLAIALAKQEILCVIFNSTFRTRSRT